MVSRQELELSPVVAVNPSTGLGLEGDGQLRQKITGPVWYVGGQLRVRMLEVIILTALLFTYG